MIHTSELCPLRVALAGPAVGEATKVIDV